MTSVLQTKHTSVLVFIATMGNPIIDEAIVSLQFILLMCILLLILNPCCMSNIVKILSSIPLIIILVTQSFALTVRGK